MNIFIFMTGAFGYGIIELIFRGYTHWSMLLTGGACFLTLYYLNKEYNKAPIVLKALVGALVITLYEFFVGLIVNVWFEWYIWDYHDETANVLGQICPLYSGLWFLLCLVMLLISKGLYYKFRASPP